MDVSLVYRAGHAGIEAFVVIFIILFIIYVIAKATA